MLYSFRQKLARAPHLKIVFSAVLAASAACKAPRDKAAGAGGAPAAAADQKLGYYDTPFGQLEFTFAPVAEGDTLMLQGDIGIDPAKIATKPSKGLYAVGTADIGYLWPNARVPYQFDVTQADVASIGLSSVEEFKDLMQRAMRTWEKDQSGNPTGWTFEEAGHEDFNSLLIKVDSKLEGGSVSVTGRAHGVSELKMGQGSCDDLNVAVHELGHAIGLWHEQMRPDRDQYIRINWNHIREEKKAQYGARLNAEMLTPYDRNSIMHYSPRIWSLGGPTYEFLDGGDYPSKLQHPSPGDYAGVRKLAKMVKSSFINPASLAVQAASFVDSGTGKKPSYIQLAKNEEASFYRYTIEAQDGAGVGMAGYLYDQAFYTDLLQPASYVMKISACTFPQLSTTKSESCGPATPVSFTVTAANDATERLARIDYASLKAQWNSNYYKIHSSLDSLQQMASSCNVSQRGDMVNFVIALRDKYKLKIDNRTLQATLSEKRYLNSTDYANSRKGKAGLGLAPKITSAPTRLDAPAPRVEAPISRLDTEGRLDAGELSARMPGTPKSAGLVDQAGGFSAESGSFFSRHKTPLVLAGVTLAGAAVGLAFLALELQKGGGDDSDSFPGPWKYSSEEAYTANDCGAAQRARDQFEGAVGRLAAVISEIEAKLASGEAAFGP